MKETVVKLDKENLDRKLAEYLKKMPWTYSFHESEGTVNFSNVATKTNTEEQFLESMKEDGAKQVFAGRGQFSYAISRARGKLFLGLVDKSGKAVEGPKEIDERTALEVFRESEKKMRSLGSLIGLGKQRVAPNHVVLDYRSISRVDLRTVDKGRLVEIAGKGFRVELRHDGGGLFMNEP